MSVGNPGLPGSSFGRRRAGGVRAHAIGGATNSRHIYGDACDIALEEIKRLCPWEGGRADFDRACDKIFAGGGFGQYPMGSRHVDSRGNRARWTSF